MLCGMLASVRSVKPAAGAPSSASAIPTDSTMTRDVRAAVRALARPSTTGPDDAADRLFQNWDHHVLVAAVAGRLNDSLLTRARDRAETARVDKQLGASARSAGSTTLAERPGFAELLALAVEYGAVEKTNGATSVTFSTTPYAFFVLPNQDNAAHYEAYGIWRRIGLSATFPLGDSGATSETDLGSLEAWSVKVRLLGERGGRSKGFVNLWNAQVRPVLQQAANVESGMLEEFFVMNSSLRARSDTLRSLTHARAVAYLLRHRSDTPDELQAGLEEILISSLQEGVYDPVAAGEMPISAASLDAALTSLGVLSDMQNALRVLRAEEHSLIEEANSGPTLSLEYTDHDLTLSSAYHDGSLLFETHLAPADVVLNADVTWYHHTDPLLRPHRVRTSAVALAAEFRLSRAVRFTSSPDDRSATTLALSGRYEHPNSGTRDIAVAQVKLTLPIASGVSLPLSISWANRTELLDETEIRGHFGFTLDTDKLFALARAGR
jgi:hypothetical protein